MKNLYSAFIFLFISVFSFGQGIYLDPTPTDVGNNTVRLYVDVFSLECNCPELADADSIENPLYIWTWAPNEMRPDVIVGSETLNVLNGNWGDSNENLQLTQDPAQGGLWYFDFVGVSPSEFYDVAPSVIYEEGLSFVIKEKNGAPEGQPEQKSPDINLPVEAGGIEDFSIDYETVLTGIDGATTITNAGDERIFVTEQSGRILVFYRDGSIEQEAFLDIQSSVESGGEKGLLGLAFEPNFCESGRFYVNYTADDGGLVTRVSRFTLDPENPAVGDPDSEEILIQFDQDFGNHNGGHIEFGSDKLLYVGTGDGGSANDPNNRAQDVTSYLGKMLRIDVSPDDGYMIPTDNPFLFDDFGQDEIWSYGLRNPWKFAFDRETGNMYIADVGQNAFEEVNFEPADAEGGRNYGWRCYEAYAEAVLSECDPQEYVFPIVDYSHSNNGNCSVTGGRVYRGPSFEAFDGWYFYTDLCSGLYWAVSQLGGATFEQDLGSIGQSFVSTWGEDVWGEMYFANSNGLYRLLDPNDELEDPITQSGNTLSYSLDGVSYEWFLNGELVGSAAQLNLTEVGEYSLVLTTENGCQIESNIMVTSLSTGDYSVSRSPLTIFPNPASESVTIDLEGYSASANTLAIYSIDGRLIRSVRTNSNRLEVNLSDYAKGAYILNLLDISGNSIAQSKLIRQ